MTLEKTTSAVFFMLEPGLSDAFRHPYPDFFDFLQQPAVEVPVPVEVRRPFGAATDFGAVAAGFFPLLPAGGAAARRVKSVPTMAAGAAPLIGGSGFPIAFGAGYFYFGHIRLSYEFQTTSYEQVVARN